MTPDPALPLPPASPPGTAANPLPPSPPAGEGPGERGSVSPGNPAPHDAATEDYLAGAASLAADPQRWPRQLAELTDYLADELARVHPDLGAAPARALAGRLMARIAREYGGGTLYIPKGDAVERALRDARLWADYDGTLAGPRGIEALARREGLTAVHVYRILAAQRDLRYRQQQPDLFGGEGEAG